MALHVYAHIKVGGDEAKRTLRVTVESDPEVTVAALSSAVAAKARARGIALPAPFQLKTARGKRLKDKHKLSRFVSAGDDILVEATGAGAGPSSAGIGSADAAAARATAPGARHAAAHAGSDTPEPPQVATRPPAAGPQAASRSAGGGAVEAPRVGTATDRSEPPAAAASSSGAEGSRTSAAVSMALRAASEALARGSVRVAVARWEQLLAVKPDAVEALVARGVADAEIGEHKPAVAFFKRAVEADKNNPNAHVLLGISLKELGRHKEALKAMDAGLALILDGKSSAGAAGKGGAAGGAGGRAAAAVAESKFAPSFSVNDVMSEMAAVLMAGGDVDAAVQLLTRVITADENHVPSLLLYATECLKRGHAADALRLLLKSIVVRQDHEGVRKLLAEVLGGADGLELLQQELKAATDTAPAYAFLATVVKDYGEIDASISLYRVALGLVETSHSYALNLVHTLECTARLQEAFDAACSHLRRNRRAAVPAATGAVSCKDVLDALGGLRSVYAEAARARVQLPVADRRSPSDGDGASADAEEMRERWGDWRVRWRATDPPFASVVPAAEAEDDAEDAGPPPPPSALSEDDLDLLAIFFTLVKILWLTGQLRPLPRLIALVERVRRGRALHLTSVRNENAYYCCVAQLVQYLQCGVSDALPRCVSASLSLPAVARGGGAPEGVVFFCGDSHALPPAWQGLSLPAPFGHTMLVPALVTGLKVWHIREESSFYPKRNWEAVTAALPNGAPVIFNFGEIDCREGLLVAVEKRRYANVDAAMDKVIGIYIAALQDLVPRKRLRVWVHPVLPVLNETRALVVRYNAKLRAAVEAAPQLAWLEFFPQLLDAETQSRLVDRFELDGTHINPAYLELLQDSLSESIARER